ncbi:hypothetical protein TREES_T100002484 [Tupaia chinensis]|uniref:Uncharacterized protein n=1 Tax=Tupaia chinensis TaxID=246437 RepID=L9L9J3_TUPCH|nr:hypothetical protein TREES_T100002484 [Tupaia chinensis]
MTKLLKPTFLLDNSYRLKPESQSRTLKNTNMFKRSITALLLQTGNNTAARATCWTTSTPGDRKNESLISDDSICPGKPVVRRGGPLGRRPTSAAEAERMPDWKEPSRPAHDPPPRGTPGPSPRAPAIHPPERENGGRWADGRAETKSGNVGGQGGLSASLHPPPDDSSKRRRGEPGRAGAQGPQGAREGAAREKSAGHSKGRGGDTTSTAKKSPRYGLQLTATRKHCRPRAGSDVKAFLRIRTARCLSIP